MSLRDLAKKACGKARRLEESNPETEWELKEDIIMLGQEIEGLSQCVRDLSENNEYLRAENENLKNERDRLKSQLQFQNAIKRKVSVISTFIVYYITKFC